jgi:hypothetical protein
MTPRRRSREWPKRLGCVTNSIGNHGLEQGLTINLQSHRDMMLPAARAIEDEVQQCGNGARIEAAIFSNELAGTLSLKVKHVRSGECHSFVLLRDGSDYSMPTIRSRWSEIRKAVLDPFIGFMDGGGI